MSITLSTKLRSGIIPIGLGGTGATTAGDALTALGAQVPLVSGNNIKTINGTEILGSGNISIASGLSPTAIKIEDGYIAAANDLVRCNTTNGAFSITLPAAPADGTIIGIVDVTETFLTYNLTVNRGGSDTIENDTSCILDINGAYSAFMYNSTTTNWRLLETPFGVNGIVATPITITNYTAKVNDLVRCDTTNGAFSITMPVGIADGSIVNIADVTNSFYTHNITVLPGIGNTIESDTSLLLDINGTYASLVYNSSTTNWKLLQTPYSMLTATPIWKTVSSLYNAAAKDYIFANTVGGAFTINLPASPVANDFVTIADYAGTFGTSNLTINSNSNKILGTVQNLVLNVSSRNVTLVYADATNGWIITL